MRDAVKRAKLPADCTAYSLRHTHASQALLNGMNIKLLADNLGTSVAMIEKHYGKFLAASRRQLVEASGPSLGSSRAPYASCRSRSRRFMWPRQTLLSGVAEARGRDGPRSPGSFPPR